MAAGYAIYIAAALFGSTSWLCINAAWMELSLLIRYMPESYKLPSYLDVIVQIACGLILIVATLAQRYCSSTIIGLPGLICVLLTVCGFSQLALALFWTETATLFGVSHSLIAFVLVFVLGCVSAASNVVFMPYMARFHATALSAYFVGMGMSALVPSLISLAQGTLQYDCIANGTTTIPVFQEARFSISLYFFIVFVWLSAGAAAFMALNWLPHFLRSGRVHNRANSFSGSRSSYDITTTSPPPLPVDEPKVVVTSDTTNKYRYIIMLTCLVLTSAEMNSIIMSIQIYSALPYSLFTYHMSLTLSAVAQSVFCLLPMWIRARSLMSVVGLTVLSTTICAYIVVVALLSPTPPLHGYSIGGILSVAASVSSFALNSYIRTLITSTISEEAMTAVSIGDGHHRKPTANEKNVWATPDNEQLAVDYANKVEYTIDEDAKRRLFWCGALMQLGSTLGSLVIFPLVNVAHLFEMAPFCS